MAPPATNRTRQAVWVRPGKQTRGIVGARMNIAQLAPPVERIPPLGYGGTERVVHTLTEELIRRGHDVTLFASGDSRTSARLVPTCEQALWHHEPAYGDFAPMWSVTLGKALRELDNFDVVHSHLDHFGFALTRQASTPIVSTLHGRLDLPEHEPLYREFADVPLVSISNAQRSPVAWANFLATVYHGIDLEPFTFNPLPDSYLAYLGRVSPEKGLDTAIRVARRAGMPLRVAARMPLPFRSDPLARVDWEYWEHAVKPLLGSDVEMVGEVAGAQKDAFLRNAAALLFPVRWPEPFGLVMVEALACGTPVLALRGGSVPEVVRDSATGFICDTEDELVMAARRLRGLDRWTCRREVEQRFSPAAMARAYERVYERVIEAADRKKVLTLPRSQVMYVNGSDKTPASITLRSTVASRNGVRADTGAVT
jgi:glycosyltransferase involved in cell wall biosynthesis